MVKLEVDCPCVTPEVVLKASGHVDKFTDLMVKDEKTGTCYRADHLLKDFCSEKLQKDLSITAKEAAELKRVLAVLDDLSADELGAKLKEYGITAPDTKNPLSDPYPFNLMFQTSIGPSGLSPGFMRPETAQGIFVNFKDLYYYNGNKLPFAAAQIGQAFRNEVVEHGLGHLPFTEKQVVTPTESMYTGVDFYKILCGVSIIRSGESMENALSACCKGIKIGKILIHREGDNGQQVFPRAWTSILISLDNSGMWNL